jgi:hypothetical protein
MFLVFGLNGFLNFIPAPKDMPQEIMNVSGALMKAGFMNVVSGAEVLVALMLLANRFVRWRWHCSHRLSSGSSHFTSLSRRRPLAPEYMELYLAWGLSRRVQADAARENTVGAN